MTTVVIPAHDEASAIADVVAGCLTCDLRVARVIVVDDGSMDDTSDRARAAGAEVIRVTDNRGKGHAMRLGAAEVTTDTLVLMDGDGQDDPADIPALLDAIEAGADLVVGSRFLGTFAAGAIKPLHRWGNRLLTTLLGRLYGVSLTDTQAGFRAIRRSLWCSLPLSAAGYDIETEVLVRALERRATIVEVPVSRRPRSGGQSDLHALADGARILQRMIGLRLDLLRNPR